MSSISPRAGSNIFAPNGVSLRNLQFNHQNYNTLKTFLGDGDVYQQFLDHFELSDLAWFAAGAQRMATMPIAPSTFHPYFFTARETTQTDKDAKWRERNAMKKKLLHLLFETVSTSFL